MRYVIIGSDIYFQFPRVSYNSEIQYIENMVTNFQNKNIDFYVVVPRNDNKIEYPFKIYYTNEYPTLYSKLTAAKYSMECREIIKSNYKEGDILLTCYEWSSQFFHDLNIPMLITLFRECTDELLRQQIINK